MKEQLIYSAYIFIICWYPVFIIVSYLRIILLRTFGNITYSQNYYKYSISFHSKEHRQQYFTLLTDQFTFELKNNNRLKRVYDSKEKDNRIYTNLLISMIYLGLIAVIGSVGTILSGGNSVYFLRATLIVTLYLFVAVSTKFILNKPVELYAKQCIIKHYNL